jgi:drug/metabolite transporter (DMT)-like permease
MSWQIYLILSILLISCNGLFQRALMKDEASHAQTTVVAGLGLSGILAGIVVLLQGKLSFALSPSLILFLVLFVLLVTPGYVFSRQAYKHLGASEMVIILSTGRLWNVIGAYFFLHEHVTFQRLLGAIIIIVGVVIARYEKKSFRLNKGFGLAIIAAFFLGMSDIVGYYILRFMSASNFLVYSYLLPVLAILLVQPKTLKKLTYFFQMSKGIKLLLLSLCDTLGMLGLYLSYQAGGAASVISPLSATRVFGHLCTPITY